MSVGNLEKFRNEPEVTSCVSPLLCSCSWSCSCLSEWLLGGALGDDSGLTELRLIKDKTFINHLALQKHVDVCTYIKI